MPKVKFIKENKTVEVPVGANLRVVALKEGIPLYPGPHKYVNCMGFGLCKTCRVFIKNGKQNVSKQGLLEKIWMLLGPITLFARLGHEEELRLACKCEVKGDVDVETQPPVNWHGDRFWG